MTSDNLCMHCQFGQLVAIFGPYNIYYCEAKNTDTYQQSECRHFNKE